MSDFDSQFKKSLYLGVGWSKLGFEGVFEHLIFMDLGSVFKIFLVKMGLKKSSEGHSKGRIHLKWQIETFNFIKIHPYQIQPQIVTSPTVPSICSKIDSTWRSGQIEFIFSSYVENQDSFASEKHFR